MGSSWCRMTETHSTIHIVLWGIASQHRQYAFAIVFLFSVVQAKDRAHCLAKAIMNSISSGFSIVFSEKYEIFLHFQFYYLLSKAFVIAVGNIYNVD